MRDGTLGGCGLLGTKFLISAQDMERAVEFYRDVIGLEVQKQSPWWSELTGDGSRRASRRRDGRFPGDGPFVHGGGHRQRLRGRCAGRGKRPFRP